jgi:hypothetical protein
MQFSKLVQEFPGKIPRADQVSRRRGEAFQLPRGVLRQILFLLFGRQRATSSVIAVSRADRSLVVFRQGISQGASLAW